MYTSCSCANVTLSAWPGLSGLVSAAVLPVIGVGVGLTQAVRGGLNTPEAIRESRNGKFWDQACNLQRLNLHAMQCCLRIAGVGILQCCGWKAMRLHLFWEVTLSVVLKDNGEEEWFVYSW